MADPLSLLRQYNVNKREIVEKNSHICFGEYCWPKTVKTNYLVYGSSKDGPNKEYYTLECLLFLLKNVNLQHPVYVKQAAAEGVPGSASLSLLFTQYLTICSLLPVVRRPDRKDLLAYLFGESVTSPSIDRSAPLELPVSISDVLKAGGESGGDKNSSIKSSVGNSLLTDDDGPSANKISRLDVMQKAKEQFSARLDAPKIKKAISSTTADESTQGNESSLTTSNTTSLKDTLTVAQISALKAKRLAKKRSTIIDAENEFEKDGNQNNSSSGGVSMMLLKYDADFTREIQSKERIWRNRSTILQSTIKNFGKSIFPILQSIKSREEGSNRKPGPPAPAAPTPAVAATPINQRLATPGVGIQPTSQQQQQQYNRYDQERFYKNDHSTIGFRIDTTGTYHGLTLKSVTEGSMTPKTASTPNNNQSFQNQPSIPTPLSSSKPPKRTSKTPIIIIPATTTSLITMYNAKAILQDLRFIERKMAPDQKREDDILIQRRKPDNTSVPYRVIDNPLKLSAADWYVSNNNSCCCE
ncbi:parafibromin-like protein [Dinothrombium tinctorium]|uniref:Parafibromin-like protein n=1 Tax=Dinothrombium tinctorium TaxID=1965070 RepID=A0A3S3RSU5_9ACAR|nr:parafibromin-like protein [Dinothrombium tinctorium]RWS04856.1 parafibromin-like protein [Dinothrombium tinctorium]